MLVAPCCFTQQVSAHQTSAAQEVKADVRRRLAAGETRQQILDAYVAHYGKHVLADPRTTALDLDLYVMPPIALAAGLGIIAVLVRRLRRSQRMVSRSSWSFSTCLSTFLSRARYSKRRATREGAVMPPPRPKDDELRDVVVQPVGVASDAR